MLFTLVNVQKLKCTKTIYIGPKQFHVKNPLSHDPNLGHNFEFVEGVGNEEKLELAMTPELVLAEKGAKWGYLRGESLGIFLFLAGSGSKVELKVERERAEGED